MLTCIQAHFAYVHVHVICSIFALVSCCMLCPNLNFICPTPFSACPRPLPHVCGCVCACTTDLSVIKWSRDWFIEWFSHFLLIKSNEVKDRSQVQKNRDENMCASLGLYSCALVCPLLLHSIVRPYVNQRGLGLGGGSNTAHYCLHSPHVQPGE